MVVLRGFLLLVLLHYSASSAWTAQDPLPTKLEAVLNDADHAAAHWGILVVDAESGETVYAKDPDKLFFPASTTKLFTCAAALKALGADYRFTTSVYARGKLEAGRLHGDLMLVARGDPTLGGRTDASGKIQFRNSDHTYAGGATPAELTDTDPLAGLRELAKKVAQAGIQRISGDILVDDRYFEKARGSGSGPDLLTPIVINDNVVDVVALPGVEVGKPAKIELRPFNSYFQLDGQVETGARGTPFKLEIHTTGDRGIIVRGSMPLGRKQEVRIVPVQDPARFARSLFLELLREQGVVCSSSGLQDPTAALPATDGYQLPASAKPGKLADFTSPESDAKLKEVAVFRSPPFGEVVKVTLKVSHNLYASMLPLLIAAHQGQTTLAQGMKLERKQLAELGIDVTKISFGGGAGGANADAVTPRVIVALLRAMRGKPKFQALWDGLPVLGVDGTLATAVPKDSRARGKVFAKTGTLTWFDRLNDRQLLTSKALAGHMITAKGRTLVLAMLVNNVPLPPGTTSVREGRVLGRLCELLYEYVP